MYILKLIYEFSCLLIYALTYLFVNLIFFRCTHWHMIEGSGRWPQDLVFCWTSAVKDQHLEIPVVCLCRQAMRMLNQHRGLFWFRSRQNYIPFWSVLSCSSQYTARMVWISIIYIFLYHIQYLCNRSRFNGIHFDFAMSHWPILRMFQALEVNWLELVITDMTEDLQIVDDGLGGDVDEASDEAKRSRKLPHPEDMVIWAFTMDL